MNKRKRERERREEEREKGKIGREIAKHWCLSVTLSLPEAVYRAIVQLTVHSP